MNVYACMNVLCLALRCKDCANIVKKKKIFMSPHRPLHPSRPYLARKGVPFLNLLRLPFTHGVIDHLPILLLAKALLLKHLVLSLE